MNTNKQVIAMVVLLFMGVISLGAYTWFDVGRRASAEEEVLLVAAERGAHLFATSCRECHGNKGLGRAQHPSLIAPALNTPENTFGFREGNDGKLAERQAFIDDTITCGRNGTAMPPWAVEQGGALNFSHIDNLVGLVTTNAGGAWDLAHELAIELDEATIAGLRDALRAAEASGDADAIAAAEEALAAAEERFAAGLPIPVPSPSVTSGTCGQLQAEPTAAVGEGPADEDVPQISTDLFTPNADRGRELFFSNGCNVCHGDVGEGGIGPTIARTSLTFSQVAYQYRNPREAMPQFTTDQIPNADVYDIYAWLQTLE